MLVFAVRRCRRQQQLQQQRQQQQRQLQLRAIGDQCKNFGCIGFKSALSIWQQRQDNIETAQAFLQRMYYLHSFMATDLHACDIKWTLFVAAAMSYRYEEYLQPCPEKYVDPMTRQLDLTQLYEVISEMPRLSMVLGNIFEHNYEQFRLRSMDLLHTVIVVGRDPFIRTLEQQEHGRFFRCVCQQMPSERPSHIFEVMPYETDQRLDFYCSLRPNYSLKIAFYGGRLDEYYGWLCTGQLCAEQPILLTSDLNMAIAQSPYWPGWGASECGPVLKCIVVCEVILHPADVSLTKMGKHFTLRVTNDKWVRISYLILYNNFHSSDQLLMPQPVLRDKVLDWMLQHKKLISFGVCMTIMGLGLVISIKRSH